MTKFGYIKLTHCSGFTVPINIRGIMRLDEIGEYPDSTMVIFLDGMGIIVKEEIRDIEKTINKMI